MTLSKMFLLGLLGSFLALVMPSAPASAQAADSIKGLVALGGAMTQDLARSTWGGGTGFNVIYGVAAPVQPPRIGKVRPN